MGIWAPGLTIFAVVVVSACASRPPLENLSGDIVTGCIGPCLADWEWLTLTEINGWLHSLRDGHQIDYDMLTLSAKLWHRFRYDSLRALLLIVDLPSERASLAIDALLSCPLLGNGTFPAKSLISAKYLSCVIGHQPALRAIQHYIEANVDPGIVPTVGAIEDWPAKVSVYSDHFTQDDLLPLENLCSAVETDSADILQGALEALHTDDRIIFWGIRLPFMHALKETMVRAFQNVISYTLLIGLNALVPTVLNAGLPLQKMGPLLELVGTEPSAQLAPRLRELVVGSAPCSRISLPFMMQSLVLEDAYDDCFRDASQEWKLSWLDMACREGRMRLVKFMLGHRYWADVAPSDDLITFVARGWDLYSLTDPLDGPVGGKWRLFVRYEDVIQDGDPVLTCFRLIVQHRIRLLQSQQDRHRFRDFVSGLSTDPGLHPKSRRVAEEAVQALSR
ncbi:Uncharacterized protein PBTT_01857 [Plasmodiophora brassicae]